MTKYDIKVCHDTLRLSWYDFACTFSSHGLCSSNRNAVRLSQKQRKKLTRESVSTTDAPNDAAQPQASSNPWWVGMFFATNFVNKHQNAANIRTLRILLCESKCSLKLQTPAYFKMPQISKCCECAVLFLPLSYFAFLRLSQFFNIWSPIFFLLFHIAVVDSLYL